MDKNNLPQPKIPFRQKITLIICGILFFAILFELGLRLGGFILLSLQEYKNRSAIKQKGTYRIICLGESTTALSFGNKDEYPFQLEEILNQRNIGIKFTVINKGVCGTCTAAIVARLEDNLNQYQPDLVITMMGINDREGAIAYVDIPTSGIRALFNSLKTYKLIKLLKLHIINKVKELGIYKPEETKEVIVSESIEKTQSSNIKEQEETFKEVIEANPQNASAYVRLGRYYKDLGKQAQAEAMLKKAIETDPRSYEASAELGQWYKDQRKYSQAEEMYKKAIEISPSKVGAYAKLGWVYKDSGKHIQAEEMLKQAIQISPRNDGICVALGEWHRDQEDYTQAEVMFKRAVKLNPRNDKAYVGLAHCYREQGKPDLVKKYTQKAKDLRLEHYNLMTRHNYQKVKEILTKKGIKLVCVQYPVRSVEPLKKMFEDQEDVIFVSNERVFKQALKQASYKEYFNDMFGGDFGHCTPRGNRLLAENIAKVILSECFNMQL
ncbi:MAG: tetratricopeptide repeat protein [Candidatus Omnitrophota bacterium]